MISHHDAIEMLAILARNSPPEFQAVLRAALSSFERVMEDRQRDEMRAHRADELELSVRSLNAIEKLGINTVGELETFVGRPDDVVLAEAKRAPYHFGKKCLREVREVLKNVGLEPRRNAVPG
jgi:DNA-directed RNA polymerase alpha subunit